MTQPAQYWKPAAGDAVECGICPRACRLKEGQHGVCFIRKNEDGRMLLVAYGRASGFSVDPIEKKPLHHFLPGRYILSFGTIGCNLTCDFCQNWHISRARDESLLCENAAPEAIARSAPALGCRAVAFTYNEPVIAFEYTVDTARACRAAGLRTVAVTAGYINPKPREEFFECMDAANVDLKAFTDEFYSRHCGTSLAPVLDTLKYIRRKTRCWLEITTLLIPGENDSEAEIGELSRWVAGELGPDVPLHFSGFHPAYRLTDKPATPVETLQRAREIARAAGVRHVYTGNRHDPEGQSTFCHACGRRVIERDGFTIGELKLDGQGACAFCGAVCAGVFA